MNYSSPDLLFLVAELDMRRIALGCERIQKQTQKQNPFSKDTIEQIKTARMLNRRYMQHDYRHTDGELGQVLELSRWLVSELQTLDGQPVRMPQFSAAAMQQRTPITWEKHEVPPYQQVRQMIVQGVLG